MEPENTLPTPESKSRFENFTKVTPFSKYASMLLFVALPFIGGYVGYYYAPVKVVEIEKMNSTQEVNFPTPPQPIQTPLLPSIDLEDAEEDRYGNNPESALNTSEWMTYQNDEYHFAFDYPSNWNLEPGKNWNLESVLWGIGIGGNTDFEELSLAVIKEVPDEVNVGLELVKDGQTPHRIMTTINEYGTELLHFYSFKAAQDMQLLLSVYIEGKDYDFEFFYGFAITNYDVAEQIIKSFRFTQ